MEEIKGHICTYKQILVFSTTLVGSVDKKGP